MIDAPAASFQEIADVVMANGEHPDGGVKSHHVVRDVFSEAIGLLTP